jgi:hypothetical protein
VSGGREGIAHDNHAIDQHRLDNGKHGGLFAAGGIPGCSEGRPDFVFHFTANAHKIVQDFLLMKTISNSAVMDSDAPPAATAEKSWTVR